MNISYNWLKEYVNFDLTPDETAAALTSIGLETGGVEEVQTIKGGLEGLVIGEVLTIMPMKFGDKTVAVKLTTARYYTPSGRSIQAKGIIPDIYCHSRRPA